MSASFTICEMGEKQVGEVARLERLAFGARAWSEGALEAERTDPNKVWIVAMIEGKTVGYGGFARILEEAHIMNIAVEESAQRRGIGRALLRELLRRAKEKSCIRATLETESTNAPARALYESAGFLFSGIRPNYYGRGKHAAIYWLNEI